jgi:hypothetical protein
MLAKYGIGHISNGLASFTIGSGIVLAVILLLYCYFRIKRLLPYGIIFSLLIFLFWLLCINSEGGLIACNVYLNFWFFWEKEKEILFNDRNIKRNSEIILYH